MASTISTVELNRSIPRLSLGKIQVFTSMQDTDMTKTKHNIAKLDLKEYSYWDNMATLIASVRLLLQIWSKNNHLSSLPKVVYIAKNQLHLSI